MKKSVVYACLLLKINFHDDFRDVFKCTESRPRYSWAARVILTRASWISYRTVACPLALTRGLIQIIHGGHQKENFELLRRQAFTSLFSYTMTTVGSEGFLSMLPVYIDHVLYPTLVSEVDPV